MKPVLAPKTVEEEEAEAEDGEEEAEMITDGLGKYLAHFIHSHGATTVFACSKGELASLSHETFFSQA